MAIVTQHTKLTELLLLLVFVIFFALGINDAEGFRKIRYAKNAGMAVSPPPGRSRHVVKWH